MPSAVGGGLPQECMPVGYTPGRSWAVCCRPPLGGGLILETLPGQTPQPPPLEEGGLLPARPLKLPSWVWCLETWGGMLQGGYTLWRPARHAGIPPLTTPTPPALWTEFLTHTCKNITFAQLRLQAGNNKNNISS